MRNVKETTGPGMMRGVLPLVDLRTFCLRIPSYCLALVSVASLMVPVVENCSFQNQPLSKKDSTHHVFVSIPLPNAFVKSEKGPPERIFRDTLVIPVKGSLDSRLSKKMSNKHAR